MAEKYVPVVGDRVRATCGESVIVGEVLYAVDSGKHGAAVDIDIYGSNTLTVRSSDGWSFERIVEPIVFKPLAVARVAPKLVRGSVDDAWGNGSLEFVRSHPDLWVQFGGATWEFSDEEMESLIRVGKAELVFEGVDPA